ncbi:MAG: polysaccharide deacetylase family protein [Anaerolineae bacterium]|nr:polysaccharide deacetylase family protein [Anaerolineae bacterium]
MSRHHTLSATIIALLAVFLAGVACGPATEPTPQAVATSTQLATATTAATEPEPLAVATDTPAVPAFVRTYRLKRANYYQGTNVPPAEEEYYLTLKEDGTVQIEEEKVSTGEVSLVAQATFFVLGQQADNKPDLIRVEALGQHYVGNHTWDHTSPEGLSPEAFMDQVERTKQAILDAAGDLFTLDHDIRFLRPPYGATDANTQQYAADLGYAVVLWDVDPQDWRRPGAKVISDHIVRSVSPGAIVLMHDGGGDRTQSVEALGSVLRELSAQGYAFHNIFVP